MSADAEPRVCALCGPAFAILIPGTAEEADSDHLCSDCLRLPSPPKGSAE